MAQVEASTNLARPGRSDIWGRLITATLRRLRFVGIQLLGVVTLTFILIRLVPGDPAAVMAGPAATPRVLESIREQLGLNDPLLIQFWKYLQNIAKGDLGDSLTTGQPVVKDLIDRLPATLELITAALIISAVIAVPIGLFLARRRGRWTRPIANSYSLMAGAIPDFWLGLLLIFFFSTALGIAPPPIGRLGFTTGPDRVTGFLLIDSVITGQWSMFWLALQHLMLPVATLVLVYSGQTVKVMRSSALEADRSPFMDLYNGTGVSRSIGRRRATRLALPPVLTIMGITYGYLLGGAVLVEQVFSWGGIGQYAVQAIKSADYPAIQGFVLLAALFNILVYLIIDLIFIVVDPRMGRRS